jgi:4-amino-4-deoxy-L-arabinose transferase-like glycosyltransferase
VIRLFTSRWFPPVILALWCGFLFFYGINSGELYRTEALRAVIAQEGLRSGDWLVPTLYGQPLLTKPPGMYIAIVLASWPTGCVSETTARLPSALAATLTVLLFYWSFSRNLGRLAGLIAAAILPASVFWLDKAPSAEIDMLQVAWVTAALLFFLRALELDEDRSSILDPRSSSFLWWLAALLCVAGGVLTKWTAPLFFYATVLPLLWWRGRLRLLFGWRHLLSAGLGASICIGWAHWVAATVGWDTLWTAVSREALQHLSPAHHQETILQMAENHHHRLGYWKDAVTFPFVVLAMMLPWSVFALLTLRRGFAENLDERGRRLWQALHCWAWPNLIIWSLLPDPSPRHAAPLLPGLAGLAALVWVRWLGPHPFAESAPKKRGIAFVALLSAWLVAKVVFVEHVVPARLAERQPRAKGEAIAGLVPPGQTLHLFRLKDEGIMFYYGRPVRRWQSPEQLPSSTEPMYCMLAEAEWRQWPALGPAEPILHLYDEQGAPILLIRVDPLQALASGGR